jgi:signal transduction histidine kinase
MSFFDLAHLGYGISLVLVLGLTIMVYFRDRKSIINQLFALESFSVTIWIFTVLMADTSKTYYWALFWSKAAIIGPAFIPYFFLLFSFVFPTGKMPTLKQTSVLFLPVIFFVILSPTTLNVKDVKVESWGAALDTGILYPLLFFYFFIYIGAAFYNFIKKYKVLDKIQKYQINYILIGYSLSLLIGISTNLILVSVGRSEYSIFGPPSLIFFIIFTTYAIIKHHLFGIEVILTEILVGAIGILLLVQIFVAPTTLWKIVNGVIFVLFCIFGYLLIRGVFREIRRREELERISRAKTEFISITSHQLRTPLTVIKGYLSMILEGVYGEVSEKLKKVLDNIYLANERLIKLVNSFLNISRIELGKIELEFQETDIAELTESVVKEMESSAKEKNLYLKFEKPKELPKIFVDKEKIREVILNLIDNAIKYTQKGGVEIKLQMVNDRLRILVSDTGEGFTKEEKEKLFESFSRGSAGEKYWVEGAGVGLYIAKRIVELHQGKIWAESEGKGKGSTFFVELPLR